jgi:uncharacterized protein (DUF2235 family)
MIFLFDGTGNDATLDTEKFSNVYAINQLISDQKRVPSGKIKTQVTFYLPGVGTKFTVRKGGFPLPFGSGKIMDQYLFGDGIEQMILRAYVNLSANYHPDDEVVLLGFSRGAVAARIFSRLISDFGILSSDMLTHLDKLWYEFVEISTTRSDIEYSQKIVELQKDLAKRANGTVFHTPKGKLIKFLGVFDTVAGPRDRNIIEYVDLRDLFPASGVQHVVHLLSMHDVRQDFVLKRFEIRPNGPKVLREIWMPGVHSDVGGGYAEDLISSISLLTMAGMLQKLGGIALDEAAREKVQAGIKTKIRDGRLVINAEPSVRLKLTRTSEIRIGDEIHPLHYYFIDKTVIWKSDNFSVRYEDRIEQPTKSSPLVKEFNRWVSLRGFAPVNTAAGKPKPRRAKPKGS